MPSPRRMKDALARPYMAAKRSTSATASPVISATRAGAKRGRISAFDPIEAERVAREIALVAQADRAPGCA